MNCEQAEIVNTHTCRICKEPFSAYTALRDHYAVHHRTVYRRIRTWLGPQPIETEMEEHWYYLIKEEKKDEDEES